MSSAQPIDLQALSNSSLLSDALESIFRSVKQAKTPSALTTAFSNHFLVHFDFAIKLLHPDMGRVGTGKNKHGTDLAAFVTRASTEMVQTEKSKTVNASPLSASVAPDFTNVFHVDNSPSSPASVSPSPLNPQLPPPNRIRAILVHLEVFVNVLSAIQHAYRVLMNTTPEAVPKSLSALEIPETDEATPSDTLNPPDNTGAHTLLAVIFELLPGIRSRLGAGLQAEPKGIQSVDVTLSCLIDLSRSLQSYVLTTCLIYISELVPSPYFHDDVIDGIVEDRRRPDEIMLETARQLILHVSLFRRYMYAHTSHYTSPFDIYHRMALLLDTLPNDDYHAEYRRSILDMLIPFQSPMLTMSYADHAFDGAQFHWGLLSSNLPCARLSAFSHDNLRTVLLIPFLDIVLDAVDGFKIISPIDTSSDQALAAYALPKPPIADLESLLVHHLFNVCIMYWMPARIIGSKLIAMSDTVISSSKSTKKTGDKKTVKKATSRTPASGSTGKNASAADIHNQKVMSLLPPTHTKNPCTTAPFQLACNVLLSILGIWPQVLSKTSPYYPHYGRHFPPTKQTPQFITQEERTALNEVYREKSEPFKQRWGTVCSAMAACYTHIAALTTWDGAAHGFRTMMSLTGSVLAKYHMSYHHTLSAIPSSLAHPFHRIILQKIHFETNEHVVRSLVLHQEVMPYTEIYPLPQLCPTHCKSQNPLEVHPEQPCLPDAYTIGEVQYSMKNPNSLYEHVSLRGISWYDLSIHIYTSSSKIILGLFPDHIEHTFPSIAHTLQEGCHNLNRMAKALLRASFGLHYAYTHPVDEPQVAKMLSSVIQAYVRSKTPPGSQPPYPTTQLPHIIGRTISPPVKNSEKTSSIASSSHIQTRYEAYLDPKAQTQSVHTIFLPPPSASPIYEAIQDSDPPIIITLVLTNHPPPPSLLPSGDQQAPVVKLDISVTMPTVFLSYSNILRKLVGLIEHIVDSQRELAIRMKTLSAMDTDHSLPYQQMVDIMKSKYNLDQHRPLKKRKHTLYCRRIDIDNDARQRVFYDEPSNLNKHAKLTLEGITSDTTHVLANLTHIICEYFIERIFRTLASNQPDTRATALDAKITSTPPPILYIPTFLPPKAPFIPHFFQGLAPLQDKIPPPRTLLAGPLVALTTLGDLLHDLDLSSVLRTITPGIMPQLYDLQDVETGDSATLLNVADTDAAVTDYHTYIQHIVTHYTIPNRQSLGSVEHLLTSITSPELTTDLTGTTMKSRLSLLAQSEPQQILWRSIDMSPLIFHQCAQLMKDGWSTNRIYPGGQLMTLPLTGLTRPKPEFDWSTVELQNIKLIESEQLLLSHSKRIQPYSVVTGRQHSLFPDQSNHTLAYLDFDIIMPAFSTQSNCNHYMSKFALAPLYSSKGSNLDETNATYPSLTARACARQIILTQYLIHHARLGGELNEPTTSQLNEITLPFHVRNRPYHRQDSLLVTKHFPFRNIDMDLLDHGYDHYPLSSIYCLGQSQDDGHASTPRSHSTSSSATVARVLNDIELYTTYIHLLSAIPPSSLPLLPSFDQYAVRQSSPRGAQPSNVGGPYSIFSYDENMPMYYSGSVNTQTPWLLQHPLIPFHTFQEILLSILPGVVFHKPAMTLGSFGFVDEMVTSTVTTLVQLSLNWTNRGGLGASSARQDSSRQLTSKQYDHRLNDPWGFIMLSVYSLAIRTYIQSSTAIQSDVLRSTYLSMINIILRYHVTFILHLVSLAKTNGVEQMAASIEYHITLLLAGILWPYIFFLDAIWSLDTMEDGGDIHDPADLDKNRMDYIQHATKVQLYTLFADVHAILPSMMFTKLLYLFKCLSYADRDICGSTYARSIAQGLDKELYQPYTNMATDVIGLYLADFFLHRTSLHPSRADPTSSHFLLFGSQFAYIFYGVQYSWPRYLPYKSAYNPEFWVKQMGVQSQRVFERANDYMIKLSDPTFVVDNILIEPLKSTILHRLDQFTNDIYASFSILSSLGDQQHGGYFQQLLIHILHQYILYLHEHLNTIQSVMFNLLNYLPMTIRTRAGNSEFKDEPPISSMQYAYFKVIPPVFSSVSATVSYSMPRTSELTKPTTAIMPRSLLRPSMDEYYKLLEERTTRALVLHQVMENEVDSQEINVDVTYTPLPIFKQSQKFNVPRHIQPGAKMSAGSSHSSGTKSSQATNRSTAKALSENLDTILQHPEQKLLSNIYLVCFPKQWSEIASTYYANLAIHENSTKRHTSWMKEVKTIMPTVTKKQAKKPFPTFWPKHLFGSGSSVLYNADKFSPPSFVMTEPSTQGAYITAYSDIYNFSMLDLWQVELAAILSTYISYCQENTAPIYQAYERYLSNTPSISDADDIPLISQIKDSSDVSSNSGSGGGSGGDSRTQQQTDGRSRTALSSSGKQEIILSLPSPSELIPYHHLHPLLIAYLSSLHAPTWVSIDYKNNQEKGKDDISFANATHTPHLRYIPAFSVKTVEFLINRAADFLDQTGYKILSYDQIGASQPLFTLNKTKPQRTQQNQAAKAIGMFWTITLDLIQLLLSIAPWSPSCRARSIVAALMPVVPKLYQDGDAVFTPFSHDIRHLAREPFSSDQMRKLQLHEYFERLPKPKLKGNQPKPKLSETTQQSLYLHAGVPRLSDINDDIQSPALSHFATNQLYVQFTNLLQDRIECMDQMDTRPRGNQPSQTGRPMHIINDDVDPLIAEAWQSISDQRQRTQETSQEYVRSVTPKESVKIPFYDPKNEVLYNNYRQFFDLELYGSSRTALIALSTVTSKFFDPLKDNSELVSNYNVYVSSLRFNVLRIIVSALPTLCHTARFVSHRNEMLFESTQSPHDIDYLAALSDIISIAVYKYTYTQVLYTPVEKEYRSVIQSPAHVSASILALVCVMFYYDIDTIEMDINDKYIQYLEFIDTIVGCILQSRLIHPENSLSEDDIIDQHFAISDYLLVSFAHFIRCIDSVWVICPELKSNYWLILHRMWSLLPKAYQSMLFSPSHSTFECIAAPERFTFTPGEARGSALTPNVIEEMQLIQLITLHLYFDAVKKEVFFENEADEEESDSFESQGQFDTIGAQLIRSLHLEILPLLLNPKYKDSENKFHHDLHLFLQHRVSAITELMTASINHYAVNLFTEKEFILAAGSPHTGYLTFNLQFAQYIQLMFTFLQNLRPAALRYYMIAIYEMGTCIQFTADTSIETTRIDNAPISFPAPFDDLDWLSAPTFRQSHILYRMKQQHVSTFLECDDDLYQQRCKRIKPEEWPDDKHYYVVRHHRSLLRLKTAAPFYWSYDCILQLMESYESPFETQYYTLDSTSSYRHHGFHNEIQFLMCALYQATSCLLLTSMNVHILQFLDHMNGFISPQYFLTTVIDPKDGMKIHSGIQSTRHSRNYDTQHIIRSIRHVTGPQRFEPHHVKVTPSVHAKSYANKVKEIKNALSTSTQLSYYYSIIMKLYPIVQKFQRYALLSGLTLNSVLVMPAPTPAESRRFLPFYSFAMTCDFEERRVIKVTESATLQHYFILEHILWIMIETFSFLLTQSDDYQSFASQTDQEKIHDGLDTTLSTTSDSYSNFIKNINTIIQSDSHSRLQYTRSIARQGRTILQYCTQSRSKSKNSPSSSNGVSSITTNTTTTTTTQTNENTVATTDSSQIENAESDNNATSTPNSTGCDATENAGVGNVTSDIPELEEEKKD